VVIKTTRAACDVAFACYREIDSADSQTIGHEKVHFMIKRIALHGALSAGVASTLMPCRFAAEVLA